MARRAARARERSSRTQPPSELRAVRALSIAALALVSIALAGLIVILVVYPQVRAGGEGRTVDLTIARGEPFESVVDRLAAAGVVENPFLFALHARLLGADERLRTGAIALTDDMTPREVVQRIALGFGSAAIDVVVPEGFHRFEIAARLDRWGVCERSAFLAASADRAILDELEIPGPSAEGYLFPDTYRLREGMNARDVVRRMVRNHRARTDLVFREHEGALSALRRDLGWGRHEVLVLASIVEQEAAVRDEQRIIAGVFLNRLRDPSFVPHRLDADPTVSYGCLVDPEAAPSCAGFSGRISRAMTQDRANAYNTYRNEGLPPGPICNPGLDAIRAVLAPAPHDYLYFVARGQRRHTFSRSLSEHGGATERARASGALR